VAAARPRRRGSPVHEGLVGPRKLVGTPYLATPRLRDEYARDIAPRTEVALARLLSELYGPTATGDGAVGASPRRAPPLRAVDLGAGTGAVGRALRARFGEALAVAAVDRLPGPGVLQADLASELPAVGARVDLIVAAHLLNELFVDREPSERVDLRARRVLAWSKALLADGGLIILLEPALRDTSRELLAVRDALLTGGLEVVAPCFWTGPCPALARDRDWCHDAAPVASRPRVDYSYLVLRAAARSDVAAPGAPSADLSADLSIFRVVSDPLPEKGRLRLYGCGPAGRHPLVRLDRYTSGTNASFDDLKRGDIARIAPTQAANDGLRIGAETAVTPFASSG
jgi:hypothetical protein